MTALALAYLAVSSAPCPTAATGEPTPLVSAAAGHAAHTMHGAAPEVPEESAPVLDARCRCGCGDRAGSAAARSPLGPVLASIEAPLELPMQSTIVLEHAVLLAPGPDSARDPVPI
jgi:hypothetical protein